MFSLYKIRFTIILFLTGFIQYAEAQQKSVAREWNEEVLGAITRDLARPTVHARNLFHTSVVMYDAWAVYQPDATPFFLGNNIGGFEFELDPNYSPPFFHSSIDQTISFAVYRLLLHRFEGSPGEDRTFQAITLRMLGKGYDITNESTDYLTGGPAELGNYIASKMIEFGQQDGSNEAMGYANTYYQSVNPPLVMDDSGNPDLIDINRWQPLSISDAVDQAGNPVESVLPFLSPEWGNVFPFSLTDKDMTIYQRDGNEYRVFLDPGPPVYLDENQPACETDLFKSGFLMVSVWQSHLDPADTTTWDISPASFGNMGPIAEDWSDYSDYYHFFEGGDISQGHSKNPVTGQAYEPQIVKRADYARILAEFWADGPDSETPPGHWFSIYNYVRDHPLFENRWMGEGPTLTNLEYDLKAYLLLGGAMHDAAIAAWSVKGYYDYIRPVSAIRYLGQMGQCSDPDDMNYNPLGFPLIPGYVELVRPGDELEGDQQEHVGKIKLYTWRGPDYIDDPETDIAGVGWILAEEWWPYQRPSFVTPPFAGFVSGHSTYSRTAAEVMTLMTGTPFFPGGMGEFYAPAGDFLEFENGPSEDIYLQWATYRDASDQTSLSRIWGGIHPPVDDIPGRIMGYEIGRKSVNFINKFLGISEPEVELISLSTATINLENFTDTFQLTIHFDRRMDIEKKPELDIVAAGIELNWMDTEGGSWINDSTFQAPLIVDSIGITILNPTIIIREIKSWSMIPLKDSIHLLDLLIDLQEPELIELTSNFQLINISNLESEKFMLELSFNEACQTAENPQITFSGIATADSIFVFIDSLSYWADNSVFIAVFDWPLGIEFADSIDLGIQGVMDLAGNAMQTHIVKNYLFLDTKRPEILDLATDKPILNLSNFEEGIISVSLVFSEKCQTANEPEISFNFDAESGIEFSRIDSLSGWENDSTYTCHFFIFAEEVNSQNIGLEIGGVKDLAENEITLFVLDNFLLLDLIRPELIDFQLSHSLINVKVANEDLLEISFLFSEACDTEDHPLISFTHPLIDSFLLMSESLSGWESDSLFVAVFEIGNEEIEISDVSLRFENVRDLAANELLTTEIPDIINIDTRPPGLISLTANTYLIELENTGEATLMVNVIFDEPMNPASEVNLEWIYSEAPPEVPLIQNTDLSGWENDSSWIAVFDVLELHFIDEEVGLRINSAQDLAENEMTEWTEDSFIAVRINPVAVINQDISEIINLFPNPIKSGEILYLEANANENQAVSFQIFDYGGRLLFSGKKDSSSGNLIKISTEGLSAGLYFIHVNVDDIGSVKTFVVY